MITYHGEPVKKHTLGHAIQYLKDAREWSDALGATHQVGFREAINRVQFPCRAIGVARESLIRSGWSFVASINELQAELEES